MTMKKKTDMLRAELAKYARKIAEDKLVVGPSGNISARSGRHIYIKSSGTYFENARPSDFVSLDINSPKPGGCHSKPSCEYKFHIACYKNRPKIQAVFHTHPLMATTLYSTEIKLKPITLEFALYVADAITTVPFASPGSKKLAGAVDKAISKSDAVIMKKHGLITVGETLQEAYLKALIIERETRAQLVCRLFKKRPPYLTQAQLDSLTML